MDLIGSLILLVIVIVLIVMFVTRPLTSRRRPEVEGSQVLSALLAERDRVLNSIKELDFDNSLGKIPAEGYPVQRADLVQRGAEILRRIDQLAPVMEVVPTMAYNQDDQIEAILSARRANMADGAFTKEDEVESMVARRRKMRPDKPGLYCSQCGRLLSSSDRYCPECGHPTQ